MLLKTSITITRDRLQPFTDHTGGLDYADAGQEELEVQVEGDVLERNDELVVLGFKSTEDLNKRQREDAEEALVDEYHRAQRVQTSVTLARAVQAVMLAYNAALERRDDQRCKELVRKLAQVAA